MKTLPNRVVNEIIIDNVTFSKIVEEIDALAVDMRPTRNKEGSVENFINGCETIVKAKGFDFSQYCQDVVNRKNPVVNKSSVVNE